MTFNDKVQQACLPEASFVPTGKAVASGWGLVSQFPNQSPKKLQVCLQVGLTYMVVQTSRLFGTLEYSALKSVCL